MAGIQLPGAIRARPRALQPQCGRRGDVRRSVRAVPVPSAVLPSAEALVPGVSPRRMGEGDPAGMRVVPCGEYAEQPEQQHDADPEQHPARVALGAVADVKRSGVHPVLRRGCIPGGAHLGGDDLQGIPPAVHHQVFPSRCRGVAELLDIRAGAFQHGASHPPHLPRDAHVRRVHPLEEHSRAHHPAQPVERVRLRGAHLEAGRAIYVALRFCSLDYKRARLVVPYE